LILVRVMSDFARDFSRPFAYHKARRHRVVRPFCHAR